MVNANTYLHFMGNTEEALMFYQKLFGGKIRSMERYKDLPGGERLPAEDGNKIVHAALETPSGIMIMATDALTSMEHHITFGNNYHICLHCESEAEVDALFEKLSAGGRVEMPLNKTFWGAYFGMLQDKFNVHWMLSYTLSK